MIWFEGFFLVWKLSLQYLYWIITGTKIRKFFISQSLRKFVLPSIYLVSLSHGRRKKTWTHSSCQYWSMNHSSTLNLLEQECWDSLGVYCLPSSFLHSELNFLLMLVSFISLQGWEGGSLVGIIFMKGDIIHNQKEEERRISPFCMLL
jgi:hypothetical protein